MPAPIDDPLPEPIREGDVAVGLTPFATPPRTAGEMPFARLQAMKPAPDGSGSALLVDTRGVIWVMGADGAVRDKPFLDLRPGAGLGSAGLIEDGYESGLRDVAFHPDFLDPTAAGFGMIYTLHTATPGSAQAGVRRFDVPLANAPDGVVFEDVLTEWRVADPLGAPLAGILPSSRRELLRVEEAYTNHNAQNLAFDPNARPGDPDYGLLYMAVGDGGFQGDPEELAQDLGRIQGKVVRIDPLDPRRDVDGDGRRDAYRVPDGNPFVDRDGALPEIWASGLRSGQFLSFDTGGRGLMLIGEPGSASLEEINVGFAGANYGWDVREGTFVLDPNNHRLIYDLPPGDPGGRGLDYPIAQYDHQEIEDGDPYRTSDVAVAGGFVYRGELIPELVGKYVFGDMVVGRIFYIDVDDPTFRAAVADGRVAPGEQVTVRELRLVADGREVTLRDLAVNPRGGRVDLRFGQDDDGEIYVMSKQTGEIFRVGRPLADPIRGTGGADRLVGADALDDAIRAGGGDDVAWGLGGCDTLDGGAGDDALDGGDGDDVVGGANGGDATAGGAGTDVVRGGSGDDRVSGGAGADRIQGGGGDDRLLIDAGRDVATGGPGRDRFVLGGAADALAVIEDFDASDDVLDVAGALRAAGYAGADPIQDGTVYVAGGGGRARVMLDADGTAGPDAGRPIAFLVGLAADALVLGDNLLV